jgi:hypothetical protein
MTEPKSLQGQIRLRPATESDVPFIFNSWLKCYRHSHNTRGCENPVYFAQHHVLLEGLCKRSNIVMACNENDISQIYGYVCSEMVENVLVVHFIYVKEMYRKFGVAAMLAEAVGFKKDAPVFYTHRTYSSEGLEKKFAMVYNPYLAYSAYELGKQEAK